MVCGSVEPRQKHPAAPEALDATRGRDGEDEANSWLPFTGRDDLNKAVATQVERRGGPRFDGRREVVITCGQGDAMLDARRLPDRSGRRGDRYGSHPRWNDQSRSPRWRWSPPRPLAASGRRMVRLDTDALPTLVTGPCRGCTAGPKVVAHPTGVSGTVTVARLVSGVIAAGTGHGRASGRGVPRSVEGCPRSSPSCQWRTIERCRGG